MPICAHCGTNNPDIAKFCLACGAQLAAAAPAAGVPQGRDDRVLRPQGLDRARRDARLRVAPRGDDALLRRDARRARAARRRRREVHRRRGDGGLRRSRRCTRTTRCAPSAPRPGCSAALARAQRRARSAAGACGSRTAPASTRARSSPATRRPASGSSRATRSTSRRGSSRRRGEREVLLGDLTYRLVRDAVDVEEVEPLELKGKAEPVPAYRLVGVRAATPSGRAGSTRRWSAATRELGALLEALRGVGRRPARARLVTRRRRRRASGSRGSPTSSSMPSGHDALVAPRPLPALRRRASRSGRSPRSSGKPPGSPSATTPERRPSRSSRALALGRRGRGRPGRLARSGWHRAAFPLEELIWACATAARGARRPPRGRRLRRHPLGGADVPRADRARRSTARRDAPLLVVCADAARPDRPVARVVDRAARTARRAPAADARSTRRPSPSTCSADRPRRADARAHRRGRRGQPALRRAAPLDADRRGADRLPRRRLEADRGDRLRVGAADDPGAARSAARPPAAATSER